MTNKYQTIRLLKSEEQEGPKPDTFLQVKEVAKLLGVCPNTVRCWADSGVLRSYRIGPRHDRRVPLEAAMGLLK